jgi:hypothetical protein
MARYSGSIVSQAAQISGVPSGTTVNGYMGYWGGSATSGFKLRRVLLGMITATGVPTSQQYSVGIFRQSVAPAGTGIAAAVLGIPAENYTPQTDPTAGLFAITATTIGTTGPTIGANPYAVVPLNSQSSIDLPYELLEELICGIGTANGFAFVNLGPTLAGTTNPLPANHQIRVTAEIEV